MSVFRILTCLGLVFVASMVFGCEIRLKPVVHTVEYHSDMACAASPKDCPWAHLDEQAAFTALVNCLLAGANVIRTEDSLPRNDPSEFRRQLPPQKNNRAAAGNSAKSTFA